MGIATLTEFYVWRRFCYNKESCYLNTSVCFLFLSLVYISFRFSLHLVLFRSLRFRGVNIRGVPRNTSRIFPAICGHVIKMFWTVFGIKRNGIKRTTSDDRKIPKILCFHSETNLTLGNINWSISYFLPWNILYIAELYWRREFGRRERESNDKIYSQKHNESQIIGSKFPSDGQDLRVLF